MRTAHSFDVSALRAASFIALSALASIGAAAATRGSTDIYASNEIAASFGAAQRSRPRRQGPAITAGPLIRGVNGFPASFGPADSIAPATSVCHSGSTEMYASTDSLLSSASRRPRLPSIWRKLPRCLTVLR